MAVVVRHVFGKKDKIEFLLYANMYDRCLSLDVGLALV